MNQLFIELYLDEDVDVLIADLIRARGFKATTTQEANMLGANDSKQLEHAASRKCALVTHNRVDFEAQAKEYFAEERIHHGIIIAARHSPQKIVRRLLIILDNVTADEMVNQVRYV